MCTLRISCRECVRIWSVYSMHIRIPDDVLSNAVWASVYVPVIVQQSLMYVLYVCACTSPASPCSYNENWPNVLLGYVFLTLIVSVIDQVVSSTLALLVL